MALGLWISLSLRTTVSYYTMLLGAKPNEVLGMESIAGRFISMTFPWGSITNSEASSCFCPRAEESTKGELGLLFLFVPSDI